jgi:hypothetical protein
MRKSKSSTDRPGVARPGVGAMLLAAAVSICGLGVVSPLAALVHYDQGRREVLGVTLLQDTSDEKAYYYLPQYPHLAQRPDGTFELLCLKYVNGQGKASGGIFHALIAFSLPPEALDAVNRELAKQVPGARVVGAVPLLKATDDEDGVGSFKVVSAVLSEASGGTPAAGTPTFTRQLLVEGRAPVGPDSKAVIAAHLTESGATLLFESLGRPTSDVSVAMHATYEALVQGYNAKVTADVETVYKHFSQISSFQQDYTKRQLRKVVDDLQRDGTLKVEVVDRTAGLGLKAAEMEAVLQLVTDKLTALMFDHTAGWAKDPEREAAVEANQLLGRQDRGWFAETFLGADDTKYYTDDQYVLKDRKDVRHNTFSLLLAKSTTVRVPVDTAGNLGGVAAALPGYFDVVNLEDPDFGQYAVRFHVDGEAVEAFKNDVNFVTVALRKTYPGKPAVTGSAVLVGRDVGQGTSVRELTFPRLGLTGANWNEFEYQVRWSLRDRPTLSVPSNQDAWIKSHDPSVALTAPFARTVLAIDAERARFAERGFATATVEIASVLAGKPRIERKATLRATDADAGTTVTVYHDRDEPLALRVSWYGADRTVVGQLEPLASDYLFLTPPAPVAPPAPQPGGGR